MGQTMPSESRSKRRRQRKKQQKNKGWKSRPLSWISSVKHLLFGSTCNIDTALISEAAKFCSDNHAHIVCDYAKHKFVPVASFLEGKELFRSYAVPGKEDTDIKVMEEVLSRFLIGVFLRFELLHSEGKCLNGRFSAESIFVPREDLAITPQIDVRFGSLPSDAFKPYNEKGGDLDLLRVGCILEHDILSSEINLPADLKQLLDLLRSDPVSKKSLIYSHVSLKGLKEKLSYFIWMYKRLLYLKIKHRDKYDNIMKKMSCDKDWRRRAKENKFLKKLCPIARRGQKGGYSKDGEGESRFYRNSVEHLPKILQENKKKIDKSENGNQRSGDQQSENEPVAQKNYDQAAAPKKGVQLEAQEKGTRLLSEDDDEQMEDYFTAIVLLETFPEFLGHLQKAVYEENELESCNAEGPKTHDKNSLQVSQLRGIS